VSAPAGSRSASAVQDALRRADVTPRHAWGQHFLHDEQLLARQVAYAELDGSQSVLEIGPGIGNLTARLAPQCRQLTAVELDRRFAPLLEPLAQRWPQLRLVWGDALTVALPDADVTVGNLPYAPALPLVFRLLEQRCPRAVFLVQRSLAERLCARVGQPHYGRLSVAVGRLADAELLERVPPAAFYPPPEVESALLVLRRQPPRFTVPDEAFFRALLERLFVLRLEPLGAALTTAGVTGQGLAAALAAVGPAAGRPVCSLAPRVFGRLAWALWDSGVRGLGGVAKAHPGRPPAH